MADSADGDLEYSIKFPSSTPKELSPNSENDGFVFVYDEEKLPVVVLLGWAGCQDKYLAKYSAIYEDRGCITLRCTAPIVSTFLRHDKLPKLGEKLLDLLHDMSLDEHPIFFHIFSNGGAFFYQHISLQMQKQYRELEVKGVIFDSAPGERRFYSVYRAIAAIIGGSVWYNVPVSLVVSFILFSFFIILAYIKAAIEMKKPQTEPIVLAEEPYMWPQLFIYSIDDELVRFEDVVLSNFIAKRFRFSPKQRETEYQNLAFHNITVTHHMRQTTRNGSFSLLDEGAVQKLLLLLLVTGLPKPSQTVTHLSFPINQYLLFIDFF